MPQAARSHPPGMFCYSQNQNGPCSRRWHAGNACSRPAPAWAGLQSRTAPRTAGWPAQRARQSCGTSAHRPTRLPRHKAQARRRTRQGAPPGRPCIHKIRANNMSQPPRTALPAPCTAPKGPRGASLSVYLWPCAASKLAPICIIPLSNYRTYAPVRKESICARIHSTVSARPCSKV